MFAFNALLVCPSDELREKFPVRPGENYSDLSRSDRCLTVRVDDREMDGNAAYYISYTGDLKAWMTGLRVWSAFGIKVGRFTHSAYKPGTNETVDIASLALPADVEPTCLWVWFETIRTPGTNDSFVVSVNINYDQFTRGARVTLPLPVMMDIAEQVSKIYLGRLESVPA